MTNILFFRKVINNTTKEDNQGKLLEDFCKHLEDDVFLGSELLSDNDFIGWH